MKKSVFIAILLSISIINVYAQINGARTQKIYWQNKEIVLSDSIVDENATMYVPVRELFEKAGCNVFWKNDDKSVFINHEPTILDPDLQKKFALNFKASLENSTDGVLDTGVKYRYISQADFYDETYEIDYEKYFSERNMSGGYDYPKGLVSDAETAVKLALTYWHEEGNNDKMYEVFYDFNNDAWIVCDRSEKDFDPKGPQGIVIRSYDGQVLSTYGSGWNNTSNVKEVYGE